jgi:hypothetical protein
MQDRLRNWLRPNVRRSTIALASGLGAGTLLLTAFTVFGSVGLLPESRRPQAWHWFLCLSVSGLTGVAAIAHLENLQASDRRGGNWGGSGGWFGPKPNGSLYERTTTQLAVHLLKLEPGTHEFQAFTVAGADVMNHVGSVHGTVHELPVPQIVQPCQEPFIGSSASQSPRPAGQPQPDELATIAALNHLFEAPHHATARPAESNFGGNSPGTNFSPMASPPPPGESSAPTEPAPTVRHNSFFGEIEL